MARPSVWILGNQLSRSISSFPRDRQTPIVMVEATAAANRLPYHRRKLVAIWSAMRHFAEELRQDGYVVDYRYARRLTDGLRAHVAQYKPSAIVVAEPADWNGRQLAQALPATLGLPVTITPDNLFLCDGETFQSWAAGKRALRLDPFYAMMRQRCRALLDEHGNPAGGRWSYDELNREPPKPMETPLPRRFPPDAITQTVMEKVCGLAGHYGLLADFDLPVTRKNALAALHDFLDHRLALFGPYEDAMLHDRPVMYHSALSVAMNVGLLAPLEVVRAAEERYRSGLAPLNSVEGYVRQVLGWREFVRQMYWRNMPGYRSANYFDLHRPLPELYWQPEECLMFCLREAVADTLASAYTHHIVRLMVAGNFALLFGVRPQEINFWFWVAYGDAYEWVVSPNVLGLSQFADGGLLATKPYVSSANYINRMSDYCGRCHYNPRQRVGERACPYNFLYWTFLAEQAPRLRGNPRAALLYSALDRLPAADRLTMRRTAERYRDQLAGRDAYTYWGLRAP